MSSLHPFYPVIMSIGSLGLWLKTQLYQFIAKSKWKFGPHVIKFPQGVPDILHSQEWGGQPQNHNA